MAQFIVPLQHCQRCNILLSSKRNVNHPISNLGLRQILLSLCLVGLTLSLPAQETQTKPIVAGDYLVENWQTDEGLPRSTIFSITQDRAGYLWMGTPYGLIRYDGVRFVSFEQAASAALGKGEVREVCSDREGKLWIATRRSGLLMRGGGNTFNVVNDFLLKTNAPVDSVVQDASGTVWAILGDGQLYRRGGDTGFVRAGDLSSITRGPTLYKLTTTHTGQVWFRKQDAYGWLSNGIPMNITRVTGGVITLSPGRDGGMWISTGNELRYCAPGVCNAGQLVAKLSLGIYGVTMMHEDKMGTLWVGTARDGLFRLVNDKLVKVESVHHAIRDIFTDAESNLWVGTEGGGLFKLRPKVFNIINKDSGLLNEHVLSVCEDLVAYQGGGFGRITSPLSAKTVTNPVQRSVTSLAPDGAGGYWLGTAAGRLIRINENHEEVFVTTVGFQDRQVRALHRDKEGNLWVGGFPSGLFQIPKGASPVLKYLNNPYFNNFSVNAIAEDANGTIWVGNSGGELFQRQTNGWRKFDKSHGLPELPIGTLHFTKDGSLWIGSLGGGLGHYSKGRFQFASVSDGLRDDVISQLAEDANGWLWMGSSRGIFRVKLANLSALMGGEVGSVDPLYFGPSDGLLNVDCGTGSQPSVWKMASGELRFATSKGVVLINPGTLAFNKIPPPLHFESAVADEKTLNDKEGNRLPHDYKKLVFRYTAISFIAPEKVTFKRKLVGFDEDWIEEKNLRSATYPRLPPGQYEFQVKAANNDGVWNEVPVVIAFEVMPAFWQTAWFRFLTLIAFTILVVVLVRYLVVLRLRRKLKRLEHAHALERDRARIARDLHDDLGARLTQMAFLTDLAAGDPGASTDIESQLREVSRQARQATISLDETVWMVNPEKDSLPHLVEYLAHHSTEFFRRTAINCRQDICIRPPDIPVPGEIRHHVFFAFKEALTNVLKHSNATEVRVRIAVRGALLRISIRDNGCGCKVDSSSTRNGLLNMRQRLESAGGRYRWHSSPGKGTTVVLSLNLDTKSSGAAAKPRA